MTRSRRATPPPSWTTRPIPLAGPSGLQTLARYSVNISPDPAAFIGELVGARYGSIDILQVQASTFRTFRDDAMAQRMRDPPVAFSLVRKGQQRTQHEGKDSTAIAGQMMLSRNDRPMSGLISGPFDALYIMLPLATVRSWDLQIENIYGMTLPISPFTLGVGSFLAGLANGSRPPAAADGPLLERAIIDLLHASLQSLDEAAVPSLQTTTIRVRADSIIDHLYRDPSLDPAGIARRLGVSVRQLHRSYQSEPASVTATLRQRRLDQAAQLLRQLDPQQSTPTAEIAAAVGFRGPGQFRRAFHTAYGVTPTEYREQVIDLGDPRP